MADQSWGYSAAQQDLHTAFPHPLEHSIAVRAISTCALESVPLKAVYEPRAKARLSTLSEASKQ
jgi:hypothetical protein